MQLKTLGFVRSGLYICNSGKTDYQTSRGLYWVYPRAPTYLRFDSTYLDPRDYRYNHGHGFTLRCLAR